MCATCSMWDLPKAQPLRVIDTTIGRPKEMSTTISALTQSGRMLAIGYFDGIVEVGGDVDRLHASHTGMKRSVFETFCSFRRGQVRHSFTGDRLMFQHPGFTSKVLAIQLDTTCVMAVYANGILRRWRVRGMQ